MAAAADDRTFVLEESPVGGHATTWYLLRLTPGATHPTQLSKLPTVAFPWAVQPVTADEPLAKMFRALDVSTAGHDLLADSRAFAQVTTSRTYSKTASVTPCGVTLMSSDGILVCGSSGDGNASYQPACPLADPTIASYSASGKRLQVLYRWQAPQCLSANTTVMWTSPDGRTAIVSLGLSMKGIKVTAPESSRLGIVSGGHLTVLPPLLAGNYAIIAF